MVHSFYRRQKWDRSKFFRGHVDKYTWVDVGSSFLPSDILCSVLLSQLEENKFIQNKRRMIWNYYNDNLNNWAIDNKIKLPYVPDHCEQAYHMFYMLMPSLNARTELITFIYYVQKIY